jgi:hypothetical protein
MVSSDSPPLVPEHERECSSPRRTEPLSSPTQPPPSSPTPESNTVASTPRGSDTDLSKQRPTASAVITAPKPAKRRVANEIPEDFQKLVGLQPETHEHHRGTSAHAMRVGRRLLLPDDKPRSVGKWAGKNMLRWMKRLYKEDLPVVTLATAAALFGAFVLGGPLPDPRVAERAAILKTALVAAVTEAGVLYPLVFAVSSIRNHRLHGFKSLRAIGRGLHGTAVRMAGLFTAKKVLGLAVHTAAIAGATMAAALLPIGVAAAWAVGVIAGNVAATGVMLAVGDVAERGLLWVGRKCRPFCDRLFPGLKRAREREQEQHNERVRNATTTSPADWREHQQWRAINEILHVYDRVGRSGRGARRDEVSPRDAHRALRRRLSDYRVANYALMTALKEVRKDPEFALSLRAQERGVADHIEDFLIATEQTSGEKPSQRRHEHTKHEHSLLDAYVEGDVATNPYFAEVDRLDREHGLLLGLAEDAATLGTFAARHIRAAAEVSLRDTTWGSDLMGRHSDSSDLFDRPAVEVVNDGLELVHEPVLRRFSPERTSTSLAA